MKIKPTRNNVLVRKDEAKEVSIGGIILPNGEKNKVERGTIVAIGQGRYETGVWVKPVLEVGDKVLYGKYAGMEIEDGKETFWLLGDHEIVAVVE